MSTTAAPDRVRIEPRRNEVSEPDLRQLVEIVSIYFPDPTAELQLVRHHIAHADSIRLARRGDGTIVGYSVASSLRRLTPFYGRPITVIYQRMLYLRPDSLCRGLGKGLLAATLRDLLGSLWPLRRFAVICRTQNPVVARMMDMHTLSFPQHGQPLPAALHAFAESLLPMLGAKAIDDKGLLLGTLEPFRGADYTDIWNQYLDRRGTSYEELMLDTAFTQRDGRVINNGAFLLMLAYSKPLRFLRYLFT